VESSGRTNGVIPLIIDTAVRERIAAVKQHASWNIFTRDELKKMIETGYAPGSEGEFVVMIHVGFKVVYSQEEHPIGLCHHLSVSLNAAHRAPSIPAVEMIMEEFGFARPLKDCVVWLDQGVIVNVVAPINSESHFPPASNAPKDVSP